MNQDIRQSSETGQVQFLADTLPVLVQTCPAFLKDCAMKTLPLTQGKFAVVDDEDYPELSKHKWFAEQDNNIFYARRFLPQKKGKRPSMRMPRQIMGLESGNKKQIDHINHNGLDNRRCNLRICTSQQNTFNRKKNENCSSRYKGVSLHLGRFKNGKRYKSFWESRIKFKSVQIYLGSFTNEIDAAFAYDVKAKELFGEFAYPNFSRDKK